MATKDRDRGAFEKIGETLGGFAGRAAGRATDMGMEVIGSLVGSAAGVLGDWWSTPAARDATRTFGGDEDRACRGHFTARGDAAPADAYDDARPMYQYGHTARQNPAYRGRSFREVEPELERAWTGDATTGKRPWTEVREYVAFGYQPAAGDVLRETREAGMRAQGGGTADDHDIRSGARDVPEM
jgi:hypothetical protein